MTDDNLLDVVDHWDKLGWYDRKRIFWMCLKYKHRITVNKVISLATGLSMLIVLRSDQHPRYKTGLLVIIVLFYFYFTLLEFLLKRGKLV